MSVKNLSILSGTTLSATGGTAMPFLPYGKVISNGVSVMNMAEPVYALRNTVTVSIKHPTMGADGNLTKFKKKCTYVRPHILANGTVVYPVARIEFEDHPEMTAAEITEFRLRVAQMLTDADMIAFWETGSTE